MSIAEVTTATHALPTEACVACASDRLVIRSLPDGTACPSTGYADDGATEISCSDCGSVSVWSDRELEAIAEAA